MPPLRALLALALLALAGCAKDVEVQLPAPGSMLAAGDPVRFVASTEAGALEISLDSGHEQRVGADDEGMVYAELPAVDGLGVLTAAPDGEEEDAATRAFLQGRYRDASQRQPALVTAWLTPELLNAGEASVAGLITDMLQEVGLARYVDEVIELPVPIGTLTMTVRSVEHGPVVVALWVDNAGRLRLLAEIERVDMTFTSTHDVYPELLDYTGGVVGAATLDWVRIRSTVNLDRIACRPGATCVDGPLLRDVEVEHGGFTIEDPNCLVLGGLLDLCGTVEDWLRGGIKQPLADAANAATDHALGHLVDSLEPELQIAFPRPIEKAMVLGRATTSGGSVVLEYDGLVHAIEPTVALPGQGPLERLNRVEEGTGICLGEAAVNALSFAAWDAGNMTGLAYSQEELLRLGLPEEFPWTAIEGSVVTAHLPPILRVADGVTWMDVGGVVGVVDAGDFGEAVVRGSATVPVSVHHDEDGVIRLTLRRAEGGPQLRLLGLGFDQAHDLLDRARAAEIVEVMVPALLEGLFEELSNLQLPNLGIPPLDPEGGSTARADVVLHPEEIAVVGNGWCIPASLVR